VDESEPRRTVRAPRATHGGEPGWFDEVAEFLGPTYWAPGTGRVMSFTTGTEQEVEFLVDALGLVPGQRILDVGCGPGRHSLALAARGFDVVGVDRAPTFVELARANAAAVGLDVRFEVADVRELAYGADFDAAICLCQGGFGLLGGRDEVEVFGRIVAAIRPGGALALSAFHAPFAVRFLDADEEFDAATGVVHERSTMRNADGAEETFDLWTTCFTARELELLARSTGVELEGVYGVHPGRYARTPPDLTVPELLLVGHVR
jgi:SAM-dependent methyltransferase